MSNVKKTKFSGQPVDMSQSLIGRRFVAPGGYYAFKASIDDDGTIELTEIKTDKGMVFLVSGTVKVNDVERNAQIAVTDNEVLNDVFENAKTGTISLIEVTVKNGKCYSRLLDNFESQLLMEAALAEEKSKTENAEIEA